MNEQTQTTEPGGDAPAGDEVKQQPAADAAATSEAPANDSAQGDAASAEKPSERIKIGTQRATDDADAASEDLRPKPVTVVSSRS